MKYATPMLGLAIVMASVGLAAAILLPKVLVVCMIVGTVHVGMYRWFAIPSDRRKWRKYFKAQRAKEISQLRLILTEIEVVRDRNKKSPGD